MAYCFNERVNIEADDDLGKENELKNGRASVTHFKFVVFKRAIRYDLVKERFLGIMDLHVIPATALVVPNPTDFISGWHEDVQLGSLATFVMLGFGHDHEVLFRGVYHSDRHVIFGSKFTRPKSIVLDGVENRLVFRRTLNGISSVTRKSQENLPIVNFLINHNTI